MSKDPVISRLVRWLAGIAATALSIYLVWYFTQPKQAPPPPAPAAMRTLEGMVYSGSAPVPKAMVAVVLTGVPAENKPVYDMTDKNGAYRFDFTGMPVNAGATMIVRAGGYMDSEPQTIIVSLEPDVHVDVSLAPVPGADRDSAAPSAAQQNGKIPAYVRKSDAEAIAVRIAATAPAKQ